MLEIRLFYVLCSTVQQRDGKPVPHAVILSGAKNPFPPWRTCAGLCVFRAANDRPCASILHFAFCILRTLTRNLLSILQTANPFLFCRWQSAKHRQFSILNSQFSIPTGRETRPLRADASLSPVNCPLSPINSYFLLLPSYFFPRFSPTAQTGCYTSWRRIRPFSRAPHGFRFPPPCPPALPESRPLPEWWTDGGPR